jgi:adenosine deaminase
MTADNEPELDNGHVVAGFAAEALRSLTPAQVAYIKRLPKAELHAHLNGSIPLPVLRQLALEHAAADKSDSTYTPARLSPIVQAGLERLQNGVELNQIHDFFGLFPAIYALTSTPVAVRRATRGVLHEFLGGDNPQCAYLELRTTPRETPAMGRLEYMRAVLEEVEQYPPEAAAVIISLDRKMEEAVVEQCLDIARRLREEGRRIVGVDLCGDPTVRSRLFAHLLFRASYKRYE